MKIFIAGARSITAIDNYVHNKLLSILQKQHDVLIGDCYGVDTVVQSFFAENAYPKVTIYASNGVPRNNIGKWNTKCVRVESNVRGFDFFRQKDIAMAKDSDFGFMIWDGESRGTLHNIITLVEQNKTVLVYLQKLQKPLAIHSLAETQQLLNVCTDSARREYHKLMSIKRYPATEELEQLSMLS